MWKDTRLVRTGQTVDIMFDVTNPGLWMAHCHIAEHIERQAIGRQSLADRSTKSKR